MPYEELRTIEVENELYYNANDVLYWLKTMQETLGSDKYVGKKFFKDVEKQLKKDGLAILNGD